MANLTTLVDHRRVIRTKFTRNANISEDNFTEAQKKLEERGTPREIRLAMRKALTSFESVEKANTELCDVQDQIDLHPQNEERVGKIDGGDDGEAKYMNRFAELKARSQEAEAMFDEDDRESKADDLTPEHFAQCMKEAMQGVSSGITGEQLAEILSTLTHRKWHIQIPKFKGDVELFDQWRELVEAEVEKPGYSEVEKAHVVLSLVDGEVAKLVSSLKDPSYEELLLFLENRYGDVIARMEHAVNEIAGIPTISNPSVKELDPFYNKLVANWNYITKRVKDEAKMVEMSWVLTALVRPKLPKSLVKRWDGERIKAERGRKEESVLPITFDILLQKLQDAVKVARRSAPIDGVSAAPRKDDKRRDVREKENTKATGYALSVNKNSVRKPPRTQQSYDNRGRSQRSQQSYNETKCPFCDGNHKPYLCDQVTKMSVDERMERVRKSGACFNCLGNHFASSCPSTNTCKTCNLNHHSLLHFDKRGEKARQRTTGTSDYTNREVEEKRSFDGDHSKDKESVALVKALNSKRDILMQSGIAKLESNSAVTRGRVFFDTGSGPNFISPQMARKLQLRGTHVVAEFTLAGGRTISLDTQRVKFCISSIIPNWKGEIFEIIAYIMESPCADINEVKQDLSELKHLKGLQIADKFPRKAEQVDVLLGLEDTTNIMEEKRIIGPRGSPIAQRSHLGWIVFGSCSSTATESHARLPVNHAAFHITSEIDIATKHWETEHIGILPNERSQRLTELEAEAVKQHEKKTVNRGGHYETGLLKHPDWTKKILKSNKQQAMRRLISLESRLKREPDLAARYQDQINELIRTGKAEHVKEEHEPQDRSVWYLPHHPVVREDKTTTKIRVVFDGSMRGPEGVSLNDTLLSGPALQPDLPGVLMRFRRHKIALIADIEKMFLQVEMNPIDRDCQRFLWRDIETDREPEIYRLTTVTFGLSPSPFSSIKTVLDHVASQREEYPKAAAEIEENIFVDDVLSGDDVGEEVSKLAADLKSILATGGWNLRKFLSNKPEVLNILAKEDIASQLTEIFVGEEIATKALGVRYLPLEDVLMFCFFEKMEDIQLETRRTVLKQLHRIYDPLGMLSPFVLKAKQLFQQSWVTTGDWDDQLPTELEEEWRLWKSEVAILDEIKIPRCLVPENFNNPVFSLHGFGDACEASYGGVVYLVVADSTSNSKHVALLCSRTRVAPLGKRRSIHELELMASLVTARLVKYVEKELKLPIASITCWTDSRVTLQWISKPAYTWQTFVANRVAEIQELVPPCNWKHVPGKSNPADLCSRGLTAENLVNASLWWNGTPFLKEAESEWPEQEEISNTDAKKTANLKAKPKLLKISPVTPVKLQTSETLKELVDRYSSFRKFIQVMSRVRSWVKIYRSKKEGSIQDKESIYDVTIEDRYQEELFWLNWAQSRTYSEEIEELKNGKQVLHSSKLAPLNPYWDEKDQVIRVGGRLHYAPLPEEMRHPIILPPHNSLVEKLVLYYHKTNLHTGPAQTLAYLRNNYWIIHGRQEVRRILHQCKVCREPVRMEQKMASLPTERVSMSPPFLNIGLDYAGPLYIKAGNDTQKAYILIFTCMLSRGVHLELTPDLSTEQFMAGLQRMINRRGKCDLIISDNAKTFKKADSLLKILYKQKKGKERLHEQVNQKEIKWKFITERAPWHGGFYERLVQSVKKPLRKVLGKARLNFLEMQTLLTDIEAQLNSRPLTSVSADKDDLSPITPGHLMIGRNLQVLPDASLGGNTTASVGKRWVYQQRLSRMFWRRWTNEYLTQLNELKKWTEIRDNIKEGDIVLVAEDNVRRTEWRLGRVESVYPGRDGLVRSVLLRTKGGVRMRRPIQKLRKLEEA